MEKIKKKFGFKDQLGYVFGDLAGSMVNLYIDMYILTFSTYVLGINAKWMAGLFLFAKIWDAINDPLIGSLPDRIRIGKSGDKFKPYIRIAMIPLALSVLMCFADVSSWSMTMKHIWIACGYLIYGMSYTGTSMPYGAMASVITRDPVERTKLSRARSLGGTSVGVLFLPLVPMLVWNKDQTVNPQAFFLLAIVACVTSIIFYIILLTLTTERYSEADIKRQTTNDYKFFDVLKEAAKNRPLIGVMVASFGNCIASASMGAMSSYLYREYYHAPRMMALTSPLSIPVLFILYPLIPKLAHKFGKRKVIIASAVYNVIFSSCLFLFPISNVYVYLVLSTLSNVGQTGFMMLIWAFITDCIDYQEVMTNKRADGTLYSIYTFSKKIATSITHSGTTYLLAAIGYVSGVATQQAGVGEGIRSMVTIMPAIAGVVEIIGMGLIFNLSKTKTDKLYAELAQRRSFAEGNGEK
ncbi:MAG: MFS transporter [Hungatella sp.]|nr:MFS transporter [Hungatella sp.]